MINSKLKNFTSIIFTISLIFTIAIPAFSLPEEATNNAIGTVQTEYSNKFNKLHFYYGLPSIKDYLNISNKNQVKGALSELYELLEKTEDNEPIYVTVEFKSGFSETPEFAEFYSETKTVKTAEQKDDLRKRLAAFSKEYHGRENAENNKFLKELNIKEAVFMKYAPFADFTMGKEELTYDFLMSLINNKKVVNISVHEKPEAQDEATDWSRTLKEIEVFESLNNGQYTGEGVKIGVYENGVCDPTHANLYDKSIIIDPDHNRYDPDNEGGITHATKVTSIIALMAPDAEIYASSSENHLDFSWFIDNGVDVINCSFGYNSSSDFGEPGVYQYIDYGYRAYFDGKVDYQIATNFINVVKSAGNVCNDTSKEKINNGHITSPGYAHNAITVGGIEITRPFLIYKKSHHSSACYISTNDKSKPEVSAVFSVDVPNIGAISGTSFAAPQVTACAAKLISGNLVWGYTPELMKSIVVAAASKTEETSTVPNSYFNEKVGAGCISFYNMVNGSVDCELDIGTLPKNGYVYTRDVTVNRNVGLKVALSWYSRNDSSNYSLNTTNVPIYDLEVCDTSDNVLYSSRLDTNSTTELIYFKSTSNKTYRIKVYLNGVGTVNLSDRLYSITYNKLP